MESLRLKKRLGAAFETVRVGSYAADVGTDHGKLAAALIITGRCPRVAATDINEHPLEKARELFCALKIEDRASALLCDGLDALSSPFPDDVVIAGLGADTIWDIVSRAEWLKDANRRLVLVPASRHSLLRRRLYENGFALENERAVYEAGHPYSVMTARYTEKCELIGGAFAALGLIRPDTPDGRLYCERELIKARKLLESAAESKKPLSPEAVKKTAEARETEEYIAGLLEVN